MKSLTGLTSGLQATLQAKNTPQMLIDKRFFLRLTGLTGKNIYIYIQYISKNDLYIKSKQKEDNQCI